MLGRGLLVSASVLLLAAQPVAAESVEDFYKGKTITVVTWQGPGSSYDAYARLIGRHFGKYIPGHPQFRVQLMGGGGGIVAANHLAKIAPKDGTMLFMVGPGLVIEQALSLNKSMIADLREFGWLGILSASNQVLVTWHTSPTQSLEDAMKRETTVGATGVGSVSYQLPSFYNNVLGTKFKIVAGYAQSTQIEVAMERGELEGRGTNPWATYKALRPNYVSEKLIKPLIQVGLRKEKDLPDVPLMLDLGKTEADREAIRFISRSVALGRPVSTTPGVPPERLAALQLAFDKAVVDPQLVAEANKQKLELEPRPGKELKKLVEDLINSPQPVRDRVKTAILPPKK
ncbi:MAG: Bug family tripartite tricarboxylate transporter substrate binding protein [Hyphomicrobiaceae bacterium]